jgi:hypothetical protein
MEPKLCVRTDPFNHAIENFRARSYGAKMKDYRPPTTSIFGAMTSDGGLDDESGTSPEAKELEKIHDEWKGLHLSTQDNLLMFEEPGFQLPHEVFGVTGVKDLVSPVSHSSGLLFTPAVSSGKLMTS